MSMGIINWCQPIPEDWDDEAKYPNKECKVFNDDDRYKGLYYRPFIFESWTYDCPANTVTGKWRITFAKCPVCGSYEVDIKEYNNLCPEQLAGSAGLKYTCKKCGYSYQESQIVS